ncbi:MAG TPA: hypothetical protein VJ692_07390 [Nitrospiraceae bacterium]|nr:hypothetical protein [Nitrospiraceae bacterium]
MSGMVERVCRIKAAKHYAKRFGKPETDEHVKANVDANWNIFVADVRETVEAMRQPTPEIHAAMRRAFERQEDVWTAGIDAALSTP